MLANTLKEDIIQEQILQAAKQLFQVYGLRKVTMDDVAKAIGKGRSSLYYYYKSKEEILDAVMDMEIGNIMKAITTAVTGAHGIEQKLNAFFTAKLNYVRDYRAFFSAMDVGMDAEEMLSYNKAKHAIHNRIFNREKELLARIITDCIETGELRTMSGSGQDTMVFVLLSSLHGLKREMAINNDFSGITTTVTKLIEMVTYGIRN